MNIFFTQRAGNVSNADGDLRSHYSGRLQVTTPNAVGQEPRCGSPLRRPRELNLPQSRLFRFSSRTPDVGL
jgi:hypothetical protein